ncbi:MAG: methyltransferase domain-containing protein [Verrucomicrobiales bacterium]
MKQVFISDISWRYLLNYFRDEKTLFRHYQELALEDCGKTFTGEVIELGGEKHYNASACFPNAEKYVVSNIDRDYDLYLDVTDMALADESADNFVMVSMLQHVDNPFQAMSEVHRTLKKGGQLLLINAFTHPFCDVRDYWRFSIDGYRSLLGDQYEIVTVYKLGGKYSAFANTFQRPRKSKNLRVLANKALGFVVALLGKVLETDDFSPLGVGILARKKG